MTTPTAPEGVIIIVGDPAMVERAIAEHPSLFVVGDGAIRLGAGGVPTINVDPPMPVAIKAPRELVNRNPLNPKQAMRANRRGRGKRRK